MITDNDWDLLGYLGLDIAALGPLGLWDRYPCR